MGQGGERLTGYRHAARGVRGENHAPREATGCILGTNRGQNPGLSRGGSGVESPQDRLGEPVSVESGGIRLTNRSA